jgi:flagellar biosynthesis/type III secretory pathway protein FliH
MAERVIKIPKPLKRVKIIRADDIDSKATSPFELEEIAKPKMDPAKVKQIREKEEFRKELQKMLIESAMRKKAPPSRKLDSVQFFGEYFFTRQKPIQIDLDKLPDDRVSVEEVQRYVQEAYDRGFAEGQQVARSDLRAEIETHKNWVRNIDDVLIRLETEYFEQIKHLQDLLPELSVMVAEQIILREVGNASDIVFENIKNAIEQLDNEDIFKIHLHPDVVESVRESRSLLFQDSSKLDKVKIIPNESVEHLGCILETSAGNIDARLSTQLAIMRKNLEEANELTMATEDDFRKSDEPRSLPEEPEDNTIFEEEMIDEEIPPEEEE